MPRLIFIIALLLLAAGAGHAQDNRRCKMVPVNGDGIVLDSLSVYSPSITFPQDSGLAFSFSLRTNTLSFTKQPARDSVLICYRVFPVLFHKPVYKRSLAGTDTNTYFFDVMPGKPVSDVHEQILATPGINKTGSLTRGVSFGNTQNVFVNSALNLQLEGNLSPELKLTAVISDQNVPFQPEGNTQQIREFDKVYIQLESKKARLLAGDIVLQNSQDANYLRYYKNIQGGQAALMLSDSSGSSVTQASAGIAKGKFASIIVPVSEGVQGPYRLQSPNGENFIIINANSERVFIDGVQLRRGFNNDYVINYNTGELTINNTIVITRYTRLRVDFEYVERNYNRTIVQASHTQTINRFNFGISHYQEGDNPNRPLSFTADTATINQLAGVLPPAILGTINGARPDVYAEGQIFYTKGFINGDSIYVFNTAGSDAANLYRVSFTNVGSGQGSYNVSTQLAIGTVYVYAGPGMGNYLPVKVVVLPNSRSMSTANAGYAISRNQQVYAEGAYSRQNTNRYALNSDALITGNALKLGYRNTASVLPGGYRYSLNADYELLSRDFRFIDRYRSIEFERDWSAATGDTLKAADHLITIGGKLEKNSENYASYRAARRVKGNNVNGYQQTAELTKSLGIVQLESRAFIMNNTTAAKPAEGGIVEGILSQSTWRRFYNTAYVKTRYGQPGYSFNTDRNAISQQGRDSIYSTSMNYDEHVFFFRKLSDTASTGFFANYSIRNDRLPVAGRLVTNTLANTATGGFNTRSKNGNTIGVTLTYRKLANKRKDITTASDDETLLGRIDWIGDYLDKAIRSELTFTTNSAQELKRVYQYVKLTTPGEGNYKWIDFNGDGLEQLDEFVEAAAPQDRWYIRVFVPGTEYVAAYSSSLNYRLNINAPRKWRGAEGIKALLSRFSNVSGVTADRKNTATNIAERYIPLISVGDANLLSAAQTLRTTVFYNRTSPVYGADVTAQDSRQKNFLSNGFDESRNREQRLNGRLNIKTFFNVQVMLLNNRRILASSYIDNRNYTIQYNEAAPELAWQPNTGIRLSTPLGFAVKHNTQGTERTEIYRFGGEVRYSKTGSRTVNANITYTRISYNSQANTAIAYDMLEALQPGNNTIVTLNLQQRLTQGLQLIFSYQGRKSENSNMSHIGKVQLSALF